LCSQPGFVTAIRKFPSHNQAITPVFPQVSRGTFILGGIHERVAHLGGAAKLASNPKRGVKIAVFIQLGAESASCKSAQQHG